MGGSGLRKKWKRIFQEVLPGAVIMHDVSRCSERALWLSPRVLVYTKIPSIGKSFPGST